ncbi:hypothetical protein BD779DRAFT_1672629 [Infundibulicybe gibba]|nr:hypothetical protein BD779DRAFT_1672629 [Infundibulicybe gibba]
MPLPRCMIELELSADRTSTAQDLPADILREIFIRCLPRAAYLPILAIKDEPRITLSHVCSSWRVIALSTPEMWTEITIDSSRVSDNFQIQDRYMALEAWLSRSSPRLFTFKLMDKFGLTQPVLSNLIFPNLHRCRHLSLTLSRKQSLELLTLPSACFSQMETIKITDYGSTAEDVAKNTVHTFQNSPKLSHASFRFYSLNNSMNIRDLNLPWRQLTSLSITRPRISAASCLDIFQQCTLLVDCNLHLSSVPDSVLRDIGLRPGPIYLHSLRALALDFAPEAHMDALMARLAGNAVFLNALHLPNLRSFQSMSQLHWSFSKLHSFLAPSSKSLQTLDLRGATIPPMGVATEKPDLFHILTILPSLIMVYLPSYYILPYRVIPGIRDGHLCPALKSIIFAYSVPVGSLLDILEGRLSVASKNSSISVITYGENTIDLNAKLDKGDHARIEALACSGIEVVLTKLY